MQTLLKHAQALVYTLLNLMPSAYQQASLQALFGLFFQAQGHPLPQHSPLKSASALSRFLNQYAWSTRRVIRATRQAALQQVLAQPRVGRRPVLQVIVDLTTAEKTGKFNHSSTSAHLPQPLAAQFQPLADLVRVYNGKRGLHVVMLYILVGQWRLPWSFRIYRGKGHPTPVQLGLGLLKRLPRTLTERFEVRVLADSGFGTIEWIEGVRRLHFHTLVGIRHDRNLADGRRVSAVKYRGTRVYLAGLQVPVTLSWYCLKREDGTTEQRFIISTQPLSGVYMTLLGRRRWQIEVFFKTIKHRFGWHRFGQTTRLGVYRWLVLALIAYLLASWAYLWSALSGQIDWGQASEVAVSALLPSVVVSNLLLSMRRYRDLARQQGLDLVVKGWRYG